MVHISLDTHGTFYLFVCAVNAYVCTVLGNKISINQSRIDKVLSGIERNARIESKLFWHYDLHVWPNCGRNNASWPIVHSHILMLPIYTTSRSRMFHSLHPLHILIYINHFTTPTVSQSQPPASILIWADEGISAFNVALVINSIRPGWQSSWFTMLVKGEQSLKCNRHLSISTIWFPAG